MNTECVVWTLSMCGSVEGSWWWTDGTGRETHRVGVGEVWQRMLELESSHNYSLLCAEKRHRNDRTGARSNGPESVPQVWVLITWTNNHSEPPTYIPVGSIANSSQPGNRSQVPMLLLQEEGQTELWVSSLSCKHTVSLADGYRKQD
jgi:hypothetical protein